MELVGSFRGGGVEAISFRPKGSDESIRVLENLALERVAKVLNVNKRREWEISAEVTEFESVNYLLLKRVALKGRAAVSSSPLETASATPTN